MPQVINFSGAYQLPPQLLGRTSEQRFDYIFEKRIWGHSNGYESVSGSGSTIRYTEIYRDQLSQYFDTLGECEFIFFDAPCGDLNWVTKSFRQNMRYVGGDISGELIKENQKKYPDVEMYQFDICSDTFPKADIWHCRHCLFHLSLSDIAKALENFAMSDLTQALITNHFLPDAVTLDIPTGSFRLLDLTNFPFYLPNPSVWLLDYDPIKGSQPMATGVWTKDEILHGVRNYHRLWGSDSR